MNLHRNRNRFRVPPSNFYTGHWWIVFITLLFGTFCFCVFFHVGDNKGDIGEEHKKDIGHTRCYISIVFIHLFLMAHCFSFVTCPHLSFVGSGVSV